MEISRSQQRQARKLAAFYCSDAAGALAAALGTRVPGSLVSARCRACNGGGRWRRNQSRTADWLHARLYSGVTTAAPEVLSWAIVEAAARQRSLQGYRGFLGVITDTREHDVVVVVREATKWIGMLTQLLVADADEAQVRDCAADLLDQDFGRVWQVGLWSNMTWQAAHTAAKKLRDSDEWEMAAALCRNAPVDDLDELHELSKAVTASQRQGRSQNQRVR